MAFDETVYLTLEGGVVLPLSHVTSAYSPSNVVIYDGATYRDDISGGIAAGDHEVTMSTRSPSAPSVIGADLASAIVQAPANTFKSFSDVVSHIVPRYLGKQRTLWTFARTVMGSAGFSHVTWGDLVLGTSSHPPYRLGMEPTEID
jgi:hypothetical protein